MASPTDSLISPGVKSSYELEGPIAGLLAAQQMEDWANAQKRSFRDSDLANASAQNKYDNEMLDNPVKASAREINQLSNQSDIGAWKDGRMEAYQNAKRDEQIQKAVAAMDTNKRLQVKDKAETVVSAFGSLVEDDDNHPTGGAINTQQWGALVPKLRAAGIDAPDTYSRAAYEDLKRKNAGALSTIPHLNAVDLEQRKAADAQALEKIKGKNSAANAAIIAAAQMTRKTNFQEEDDRVMRELNKAKALAEAGGPPVPYSVVQDTLQYYDRNIRAKDDAQIKAYMSVWVGEQVAKSKQPTVAEAKAFEKSLTKEYEDRFLGRKLAGVKVQKPNGDVVQYDEDGKQTKVTAGKSATPQERVVVNGVKVTREQQAEIHAGRAKMDLANMTIVDPKTGKVLAKIPSEALVNKDPSQAPSSVPPLPIGLPQGTPTPQGLPTNAPATDFNVMDPNAMFGIPQ
jgi:hypothetical protein